MNVFRQVPYSRAQQANLPALSLHDTFRSQRKAMKPNHTECLYLIAGLLESKTTWFYSKNNWLNYHQTHSYMIIFKSMLKVSP